MWLVIDKTLQIVCCKWKCDYVFSLLLCFFSVMQTSLFLVFYFRVIHKYKKKHVLGMHLVGHYISFLQFHFVGFLKDKDSETEEVSSDKGKVTSDKDNISSECTQNIPPTEGIMEDCHERVKQRTSGDTFSHVTHLPQRKQSTSPSQRSNLEERNLNKQGQIVKEHHQLKKQPASSSSMTCGGPSKCVRSCKPKLSDDVDESESHMVVKQLLEQHKGNIPFHDPRVYMTVAGKTKSVPNYRVLAFPDFWGHSSPAFTQKLEDKKFGSQR